MSILYNIIEFLYSSIFSSFSYINNKKIIYYENEENKIKETFFVNQFNKKNGIFISYYKNGQIRDECYYINGIKNGLVKLYYDNGQLEYKYYTHNNSFAPGLTERYYKNGQLKEKYLVSYGGKLNGDYISYYENGQIHMQNINKKKYVYYPCGKIFKLYDEINEIGIEYYKNNNISLKYELKKSTGIFNFNGKVEKYYENGRIKEIGNYIYYKKNGIIETYYDNENNSKKSIGTYKYDICINYIEYDEDGHNIINNIINNDNHNDNKKWYYLYFL